MIQVDERSPTMEKRNYLHSLALEIVDKFILRTEKMEKVLNKIQAEINMRSRKHRSISSVVSLDVAKFSNMTARQEGSMKLLVERHILCNPPKVQGQSMTTDDMLNLQLAFLEVWKLIQNFFDDISESDGERGVRCCKFFLPYLRCDGQGSAKYALEAFYLSGECTSDSKSST